MTRHRASVSAALCAVAAGPVAGGQLVLLAKPLGGVVGVPGAVVGYIVLTGAVLGLFAASLCLWRVRSSVEMASVCGVLAGIAVLVAGAADTVAVFAVAVLVAGTVTGPLLVSGRALAADLGRRSFVVMHAAATAGLVVAAWLAVRYYENPGAGVIAAGALTVVLGASAGLLRARAGAPVSRRPDTIGAVPRAALSGYGAVGLAVGGTVLPALHLLLFRWNEFGAEQLTWLVFAAVPAVFVVALPGRRPAAVPVLLILAAGGPVLVATASGPVLLTIGLAVTLTAAARAITALDEQVCLPAPHADRAAATAVVTAIAGFAGLGLVDLLGRVIGTGSALTVLAACVLVAARLCGRHDHAASPPQGVLSSHNEGGAP
ncbi:hypothetical protein AB0J48_02300 [Nocardia salmonicida]|uniref:hypothetical protein n=1 Tax=Nocardia salmonicida TaxID=53431 RepID=UPI00344AE711